MTSLLPAVSLALLSLAAHVAAHGYVQELTLGSKLYTGYLPYYDPRGQHLYVYFHEVPTCIKLALCFLLEAVLLTMY